MIDAGLWLRGMRMIINVLDFSELTLDVADEDGAYRKQDREVPDLICVDPAIAGP
jgi:hypothetical protein